MKSPSTYTNTFNWHTIDSVEEGDGYFSSFVSENTDKSPEMTRNLLTLDIRIFSIARKCYYTYTEIHTHSDTKADIMPFVKASL